MIDIHTHLLPQIDDGSQDWDETLSMIRQGIRDGIEGAICTPHILNVLDEPFESKSLFKFDQLRDLIARNNLKFTVWMGSEIHCQSVFSTFSRIVTLNNNQKYLLMELPLTEFPLDVGDKLFKLILDGITPILAHPERNSAIMKNHEIVYQFVQQGVLMQLNAGSLTGDFGRTVRQTAVELMDRGMAHFVATDCHSAGSRPMILSTARRMVSGKWGKKTAETLFDVNPGKVIRGERIEVPEPVPIVRKKSFIKKVFGR